jgi:hypothetical protein
MALAIKNERLIVGEGVRDVAFFDNLCKVHNLQGYQLEAGGGIDNYPGFFLGHQGWTKFDELRMLIVVADNDADAGKSLEKVQKALRGANLPAPQNPLEWVKRNDSPTVTIVQMPFDGACKTLGCLESLVLAAVKDAYPSQAACAETMAQCVGADKWRTHSSRDKFLLRSILTSVWEDNPNSGIKECLEKRLIPLDHKAFAPLIELLTHMPIWLSSAQKSWESWKKDNLGSGRE